MRKEADELIAQIWNEVEDRHSALPEERRLAESENYGIVYFYRKNELNRSIASSDAQSSIWP